MCRAGFKIIEVVKPIIPVVPSVDEQLVKIYCRGVVVAIRWEFASCMQFAPLVEHKVICEYVSQRVNTIPSSKDKKLVLDKIAGVGSAITLEKIELYGYLEACPEARSFSRSFD